MNTPSMLALNAFDPRGAAALDPVERALVARRAAVFGSAVPLFYERPLNIVRAEGVWLFDHEKRRYLDAYNNVPAVGHCHPHVVQAVAAQAARLNTHARYLSEVVTGYAERLLATFPAPLARVLFTTTGTESVDLALRLARCRTGRTGVIVTRFAYHGHSVAAAEITPAFGSGVGLGAHVRTVAAPAADARPQDVGPAFAQAVGQAIADLERHGTPIGALVLDSVLSSDGLFVDPPGFLADAVARVRGAGGLFVADEVQPGFGRTGAGMWGFSRHGLAPDIAVMGKPMGNGMPIGAVVTNADILDEFAARTAYFNTFGGNTVSCAAAAAVLDVIEGEGLVASAKAVGEHLRSGFLQMHSGLACIGAVRGAGLYVAVDLVRPDDRTTPDTALARRLINGLRDRQILISTCGPAGNVLKIRPPLPFSVANADQLLQAAGELLAGGG